MFLSAAAGFGFGLSLIIAIGAQNAYVLRQGLRREHVLAVVIVVLGLVLLGLIQASLQGIYAAALYRYAEAGDASVGFDHGLLQQAFSPRKK